MTEEVIQSVKLTRFETSTCIVSFKDYLKHVEEKEKAAKGTKSSNNKREHEKKGLSPEEEKEETTIRRRKRYLRLWLKKVHPEKTQPQPKSGPVMWNYWAVILAVAVFVSAIFMLRLYEATYDADYEAFQMNYDLLGIDRGAPLVDVKKAYRALTFQLYKPSHTCNPW